VGTVRGLREEEAARFEDTAHLGEHNLGRMQVLKDVIGNNGIKSLVLIGNVVPEGNLGLVQQRVFEDARIWIDATDTAKYLFETHRGVVAIPGTEIKDAIYRCGANPIKYKAPKCDVVPVFLEFRIEATIHPVDKFVAAGAGHSSI
jgi:hypothetical protein